MGVNCFKIMNKTIIKEETMSKDAATRITKLLRSFYARYHEQDYDDETNFPTIIVDDEDISNLYKNMYNYYYLTTIPEIICRIPVFRFITKADSVQLITAIYNQHKNSTATTA